MRQRQTTALMIALFVSVAPAACSDSDPVEPGLSGGGTTESIVGTWTGQVDQSGFTYDAVMTIELAEAGQAAGTIRYQFTNSTCEGDLSFDGTEAGTFVFTEENTTGGCSSPGIIEVSLRDDGTLSWAWFFPEDGSPSATAVLTKI